MDIIDMNKGKKYQGRNYPEWRISLIGIAFAANHHTD